MNSHSVGAGVQEDKLGMMPLFLGANVHFVNTKRVDAYAGYLAAYLMVNADADDTHLLPLDPTFITIGVTRKF